jgi:hypothetical protein
MAFNDAILRAAFEFRLSVIDLRLVCTEPEDHANPIEPSERGGRKIARAIIGALGLADEKPHSRVHKPETGVMERSSREALFHEFVLWEMLHAEH